MMGVNDTALEEGIRDRLGNANANLSRQPQSKTIFNAGALANADRAILAELDAIGGTKRHISVTFWTSGDTAGNITPEWYITSLTSSTTYVLRMYPVTSAAHDPGAATVETYSFDGELAEGLQLQFKVYSVGNDIGVNYECYLTYEG